MDARPRTDDGTNGEKPEFAVLAKSWAKCPECKQSATGRYLGKLGCTRCHWSEP